MFLRPPNFLKSSGFTLPAPPFFCFQQTTPIVFGMKKYRDTGETQGIHSTWDPRETPGGPYCRTQDPGVPLGTHFCLFLVCGWGGGSLVFSFCVFAFCYTPRPLDKKTAPISEEPSSSLWDEVSCSKRV